MKLKVVGWTEYDDLGFDEGENTWAARQAIIDDIRAHGYEFTGWYHEECSYGAPVLSDGRIRRYSQRGWGGLMAEANGYDRPMDYVHYAFQAEPDADIQVPGHDRCIYRRIRALAEELLDADTREALFKDDFTLRFPHPELAETELYLLTPEEAAEVSAFDTVRQVPNILYRRLFPADLKDTYRLDAATCSLDGDVITVMQNEALRLIDGGDTVILGERHFTVREVTPRKDVGEDILSLLNDREHPGYGKALRDYDKAAVKLLIRVE